MQKQLELLKKKCEEQGIIVVEDYDAKLSDSAIVKKGEYRGLYYSIVVLYI
ncbi:MAG: hypothetical protein NC087_04465 [Anaeroplasma bactoclasticum]|nr:hypothetical protein [Anaeroplasma bactoclasticum]